MTSPNDALLERLSRVHGAILQWRSQLPELHLPLYVQVPEYVGTVAQRMAAVDTLSKALGVKPDLEFWSISNTWVYESRGEVGAYTPVAAASLPPQGVETAGDSGPDRVAVV